MGNPAEINRIRDRTFYKSNKNLPKQWDIFLKSIEFLTRSFGNQLEPHQILGNPLEINGIPYQIREKSIEFLTKSFRNQLKPHHKSLGNLCKKSINIFTKSFRNQLKSLPSLLEINQIPYQIFQKSIQTLPHQQDIV